MNKTVNRVRKETKRENKQNVTTARKCVNRKTKNFEKKEQ